MSMENFLGVKAAGAVKIFVILAPVGSPYPSGFTPQNILAPKDVA